MFLVGLVILGLTKAAFEIFLGGLFLALQQIQGWRWPSSTTSIRPGESDSGNGAGTGVD